MVSWQRSNGFCMDFGNEFEDDLIKANFKIKNPPFSNRRIEGINITLNSRCYKHGKYIFKIKKSIVFKKPITCIAWSNKYIEILRFKDLCIKLLTILTLYAIMRKCEKICADNINAYLCGYWK